MQPSSQKEAQVIQIIPAAPGWRVVYQDEKGSWEEPVVCFALIEGERGRHIEPMIPVELGAIDVAPGNSVALAAPGQSTRDAIDKSGVRTITRTPEAT